MAVVLIAAAVWFLPGPTVPQAVAEDRPGGAAKTIIDLQSDRRVDEIRIQGAGGRQGRARLTNLNPAVNAWFLLEILWSDGTPEAPYHLENPFPERQRLLLEPDRPQGLVLADPDGRHVCDLWAGGPVHELAAARRAKQAYAPICQGRLYLRIPVKGHQTQIELVTEFLREDVKGGERIVTLVKRQFFKDAYQETARLLEETGEAGPETSGAPRAARLDPAFAGRAVDTASLGIDVHRPSRGGMTLGRWYPALDNPGVFVSLITPRAIAGDILRSAPKTVAGLDDTESASLVYLVAFDLQYFDLNFAMGTLHPKLGWSAHILDRMKDDRLPGPDGIDSPAPLVNTGLIGPEKAHRTVAAFTGGFKRAHGAFKWGDLALKNQGTHYGFLENGVLFSRLQPGLSTLYVGKDGVVGMKTWRESDAGMVSGLRHARQNGVPLIDYDETARTSAPGALVNNWAQGNWSGSEDSKLRTMRAGAGLQEDGGRRFLVYAVFSSATPSAMTRVFQAYGCRYAMMLDMNALEHTYLAVYRRRGEDLFTQNLIKGMREVDKTADGKYVPRFLGFPDNRDFFYLTRIDRDPRKP